MKIKIGKLSISVVLCLLAGFIGSFFTSASIPTWYATLNKPFFNPPNWIFAPVWTTLYIMMGIALYLVWVKLAEKTKTKKKSDATKAKLPFILFGTQLVLNTLWSILFFGLRQPLFAFIEVILLWTSILATIFMFYKISKKAAFLLIPYILWVSFASALNFAIWFLNH